MITFLIIIGCFCVAFFSVYGILFIGLWSIHNQLKNQEEIKEFSDNKDLNLHLELNLYVDDKPESPLR